MNKEEIIKELAKHAKACSEPLNLEKLLEKGLIIQKGKSYYVPNMHKLPEDIRKRINSMNFTKNGVRVTFIKETKKMKNLADKLSDYLE